MSGMGPGLPNRTSGTSQVQAQTSIVCAEIINRLGCLPRLGGRWMKVEERLTGGNLKRKKKKKAEMFGPVVM